jgi:hypothetical protein
LTNITHEELIYFEKKESVKIEGKIYYIGDKMKDWRKNVKLKVALEGFSGWGRGVQKLLSTYFSSDKSCNINNITIDIINSTYKSIYLFSNNINIFDILFSIFFRVDCEKETIITAILNDNNNKNNNNNINNNNNDINKNINNIINNNLNNNININYNINNLNNNLNNNNDLNNNNIKKDENEKIELNTKNEKIISSINLNNNNNNINNSNNNYSEIAVQDLEKIGLIYLNGKKVETPFNVLRYFLLNKVNLKLEILNENSFWQNYEIFFSEYESIRYNILSKAKNVKQYLKMEDLYNGLKFYHENKLQFKKKIFFNKNIQYVNNLYKQFDYETLKKLKEKKDITKPKSIFEYLNDNFSLFLDTNINVVLNKTGASFGDVFIIFSDNILDNNNNNNNIIIFSIQCRYSKGNKNKQTLNLFEIKKELVNSYNVKQIFIKNGFECEILLNKKIFIFSVTLLLFSNPKKSFPGIFKLTFL